MTDITSRRRVTQSKTRMMDRMLNQASDMDRRASRTEAPAMSLGAAVATASTAARFRTLCGKNGLAGRRSSVDMAAIRQVQRQKQVQLSQTLGSGQGSPQRLDAALRPGAARAVGTTGGGGGGGGAEELLEKQGVLLHNLVNEVARIHSRLDDLESSRHASDGGPEGSGASPASRSTPCATLRSNDQLRCEPDAAAQGGAFPAGEPPRPPNVEVLDASDDASGREDSARLPPAGGALGGS